MEGILLTLFLAVLQFGILFFYISKYGLYYYLLKCPNCLKRGGLRSQWKFSGGNQPEMEDASVIDTEMMAKEDVKVLRCKKCDYEVVTI